MTKHLNDSQKTLILICFVAISLISCSKDSPAPSPVPGVLGISSSALTLNEGVTRKFSISHLSGDEVNWTIANSPAWIQISPASGSLSKGQSVQLTVETMPQDIMPMKLTGQINITGNSNQAYSVNVNLCLDPHPRLSLNPISVNLNEQNNFFQEVTITNIGTGLLNLQGSTNAHWISFPSAEISLNPNQEFKFELNQSLDFDNLPVPRTVRDTIKFTSNDDLNPLQELIVDLVIPEIANIEHDSKTLDIGIDTIQEFYIVNKGNVLSSWEFMSSDPLIQATPSNGVLGIGDTSFIAITINRNQSLENGLYQSRIRINDADGTRVFLEKHIDYIIYNESKTLLDGQVSDAEYNKLKNEMIVVQDEPNKLWKYDENKLVSDVDLSFNPIAVSLSNDGNFAIVQGYTAFEIFDLNNLTRMQLESTTKVIDAIEVDNNGSAYVFVDGEMFVYPESGNSTSINLSSSAISNVQIHPDEKHLYALSEADELILKIDISPSSIAEVLSVSTQNTDNQITHSKLWIADDGSFLITQGGGVFDLTPNSLTNDVAFNRYIPFHFIFDLDFSASLNSIAIINGDLSFEIKPGFIYDLNASTWIINGPILRPEALRQFNGNGEYFVSTASVSYIGINSTTYEHVLVAYSERNNKRVWTINSQAIQ